ncbi:MAG: alpha-ketoacid dehydrogenase subunit beta, partial [bacterium]
MIITYKEAIKQALAEKMREDENVFLLGEDIGVYGGAFGVTMGLLDEFGPERVMDAPMSEAAFT